MKDLRVVTARAVLPIQSVAPVRGFYPPSLLVQGKNLAQTTEVEVNGILAKEFIIQSATNLIVRIPETQVGQVLTSIKAYAQISPSVDKAALNLGVIRPIKFISGIDRLVQAWLLLFFSSPGTDIFSPNSGGGARSLIGKTTDAGHQSVAADLALCIDRTKMELMKLQANAPYLPMEERLMSSSLVGVNFNRESSTLFADVSLISMAGTAAQLSLG
jgi:hypothetical protein